MSAGQIIIWLKVSKQLNNFYNNILIRRKLSKITDVKIINLEEKEKEFASVYDEILKTKRFLGQLKEN